MAYIEQIHVELAGHNRAELRESFQSCPTASWFDHFMHCVGAIDARVNWQTEHVNELENQQHFCVSVISDGSAAEMALLMDEFIHTMPIELTRHTTLGCYVRPYSYTINDHNLPYDANPVTRHGWQLVLPNVNTDAIANVMNALPTTRRMYADC